MRNNTTRSKQYDTFKNYTYDWTSQYTDINEGRQTLHFRLVQNPHDINGNRPKYETYTTQVKDVQEEQLTRYATQLIGQAQTVYTTNRVIKNEGSQSTGSAQSTGSYGGESITAANRIEIQAGGNVGISGVVDATASNGTVSINAHEDLEVVGSKPLGDSTDLPAPAGILASDSIELTATNGDLNLAASSLIGGSDATTIRVRDVTLHAGASASLKGGVFATGTLVMNAGDTASLEGYSLSRRRPRRESDRRRRGPANRHGECHRLDQHRHQDLWRERRDDVQRGQRFGQH